MNKVSITIISITYFLVITIISFLYFGNSSLEFARGFLYILGGYTLFIFIPIGLIYLVVYLKRR